MEYKLEMFVDYDHCHDIETDTDKYCKDCSKEQQKECQEKTEQE